MEVNFCLTDTRRTAPLKIDPPLSPGSHIGILDVIEVEIQTTSTGLVPLPQGIPAPDGVIVCYDSSKASSYQPIESLISELERNV